ncbi:hypothetical protein [Flavobacterium sp.]|jgi:hypothetical protein|uniref:hypothetical protein n=1 Tax=Flavobacterium sp. TaxID=239 RepID=UPI0037BE6CD2
MKILLLNRQPSAQLLGLLREHFIREDNSFFVRSLSNTLRYPIDQSEELQAQIQHQICKILLHQLYAYVEERRVADFVVHITHNHFGQALYVKPIYATEILKHLYEPVFPVENHQEIENRIVGSYQAYISSIYQRDRHRFNETFRDIMQMFIELLPANIKVLRFELAPNLAPMVCYTQPEMMQSLYA